MKTFFLFIGNGIRRFLAWLLTKPVTWIADHFSSSPKQDKVNEALSKLYDNTIDKPGKKGSMFTFDAGMQSIIIFSDHHKGARNGSDDFAICEHNYLAALDYYNERKFYYISLGDTEELWENTIFQVLKYNRATFRKERKFVERNALCKIYGNHDLLWDNDPLAPLYLKRMYGRAVKIFSGIVLRTTYADGCDIDIFCTHGHQGDSQSDGNKFSKWFVTYVWGPLQSFLRINTNSPSTNDEAKSLHNQYMYEWSAAQDNIVLITGHTHQPVFNSLTHLERLYRARQIAVAKGDHVAVESIDREIPRRKREYGHVQMNFESLKPTYFNTGCCCFDDGNITGIEIADGFLRLIKWTRINGVSTRIVAEETRLAELAAQIHSHHKHG
jgi:predicted phosphodiesterase